MHPDWTLRKRPPCLDRRIQFPDYDTLRDFLDRLADLSEAEGLYPDISFGRDYARITVQAPEGATAIEAEQEAFARRIDALLEDGDNNQ
jgi:pterin-4a-carbinolamine dehydratase